MIGIKMSALMHRLSISLTKFEKEMCQHLKINKINQNTGFQDVYNVNSNYKK
jgi:hypothetical protein